MQRPHNVNRHSINIRIERYIVHITNLARRQNIVRHRRGDKTAIIRLMVEASGVDRVVRARQPRGRQRAPRVRTIERAERRDRDGRRAGALRRRRLEVRGPKSA